MYNVRFVNWVDRRIKRRHKAPDLGVTLKATGLRSLFRPSLQVDCVDINRYGMAVESDLLFRPKERLTVSFRGKYICQSNVDAEVTECVQRQEGGYRISLVFTYALSTPNYCRQTDNALSRIESLYNNRSEPRQSRLN
jgi:hypothetical protein